MQGRITKVLNMKPPEILGLLEEAAGTKMYETKKQAALRTLEKKQLKVDEINKVLSEDIMPALDKLRKEKVQYMEWQNASSKMERLQRFCVAYKYTEAKELLRDGETEVKEVIDALSAINDNLVDIEENINRKKLDLQSLQTEKDSKSSGEVNVLSQQADALSKQIVQETSRLDNVKDAFASETKNLQSLEDSMKELNEDVVKQKIDAATTKRDEALLAVESALQDVSAAQSELAGAEAGDGRDASNKSLQERLDDTINSITETEGSAISAKNAVQHQTKKLNDVRKELKSKETNGSKLQKEYEAEEQSLQGLKERLQSFSYDEDAAQLLESKIEAEQESIRQIEDKIDQMSSRVAASEFHYKDPVKGFDRSKVKGVVSRLVKVADPKYSSALEVAAGGKLYQVIVDNEQTAKQLLSNGQLRNRVTIIPLNKVTARTLSSSAKVTAQQLAGDKAIPALELVGYNDELGAAMQYAFGSALVCKDPATAKMLAFHKDVASRCVTLDGDDFNPSGTLTGGSRNKSNCILSQLHALGQYEADLRSHQEVLSGLESEIDSLNKERSQFKKVQKEIEIKSHSLDLLKKRLEGSEMHQLMQTVHQCEADLNTAEEFEKTILAKIDGLKVLRDDLIKQIQNFDKIKERLISQAQDRLEEAKKNVDLAKKHAREGEVALQGVLADSESAAQEKENVQEQITLAKGQITKLQDQIDQMLSALRKLQDHYDSVWSTLE